MYNGNVLLIASVSIEILWKSGRKGLSDGQELMQALITEFMSNV